MPIYSNMPEDLYPRPNDVNAPLRSTIGIGPRGPKGHSITAEVIDTDPYGYFRIQFKDVETDEVLAVTPNLDVGSRFYVCTRSFEDVSTGSQHSATTFDFTTLQTSDRSAIRVGDIVFFTAHTEDETFLTLDTVAVGVVNSVNGTNVTFTTTNVMNARIADGGITTDMLANLCVTTAKLADDAVTNAKIADNAVGEDQIAPSAVTTDKIDNDAVTTAKISSEAVTNQKLGNNSVTNEKIANNSITSSKIGNGEVKTTNIDNDAVTTDKINDSAVTNIKLASGSVTPEKFNANVINYLDDLTERELREWMDEHPEKIIPSDEQAEAVITEWLEEHPEATTTVQDDAITTPKIKDRAVTNPKIARESVTTDIMQPGFLSSVLELKTVVVDSWFVGGLFFPDGMSADSQNRIGTLFIPALPGTYVHCDSLDYQFIVWEYSADNTALCLTPRSGTDFQQGDYWVTNSQCKFIRISFRKVDNSDFTDTSDASHFTIKSSREPMIVSPVKASSFGAVWEQGTILNYNNSISDLAIRTDYIACGAGTIFFVPDQFDIKLFEYVITAPDGKPSTARGVDWQDFRGKYVMVRNHATTHVRLVIRYTTFETNILPAAGDYVTISFVPSGFTNAKIRLPSLSAMGIRYDGYREPSITDGTRYSTDKYIPVSQGDVVLFNKYAGSNQQYLVYEYQTERTIDSIIATHSVSDWTDNSVYVVTNHNCNFIRITMRNSDDSVVTNYDRCFQIMSKHNYPDENFPMSQIILGSTSIPCDRFHVTSVHNNGSSYVQYSDVIDWYEDLRAEYPNYITRQVLRKDESETYDIYAYSFVPPVYNLYTNNGYEFSALTNGDARIPEILIDAGIHGNEKPAVKALYNALYAICHDWQDDPVLAFLRWNVNLRIIPVANPWGYNNEVRCNVNHVDLNRNFGAGGLWSQGGSTDPTSDNYRGTAENSENETWAILDMLNFWRWKALAYYSLHTHGVFTSYSNMFQWDKQVNLNTDDMMVVVASTLRELNQNGWAYHGIPLDSGPIGHSGAGSFSGMAANQGGRWLLPSAMPECCYYIYNQPETRDTTPVNCLNVEYIILMMINTCRMWLAKRTGHQNG